ncbi:fimbrial biogenesis outer membrane usher protein [Escherichia coli]|uniref:Fimbrial biogenesis outer membrane usher protein n=1 Tax=Escherichia coli TaxID=562 RepID=A0A376KU76_ECOLX|nr:fimbrial biogenesis outer membrane usher protein [Escherichia coli]
MSRHNLLIIFNLFYSKRGQEQISISQQLGNYGTTFFSASRQSYWEHVTQRPANIIWIKCAVW